MKWIKCEYRLPRLNQLVLIQYGEKVYKGYCKNFMYNPLKVGYWTKACMKAEKEKVKWKPYIGE